MPNSAQWSATEELSMDPSMLMAGAAGIGQGIGGQQGVLGTLFNFFGTPQSLRSQLSNEAYLGRLQARTGKEIARINQAAPNIMADLAQRRFGYGGDIFNNLLGGGGTRGVLADILSGNDAAPGMNPIGVASQYSPGWAFGNLFSNAANQFSPMSPGLFQSQLNQLMGNAASSLGGQLRGANAGLGGAGMAAASPLGQGLSNQFAAQTAGSAQNSLTSAFLNKYQQDLARAQAQAGYNTGIGNLLAQQQQTRAGFGQGLGNLALQGQQLATQRQGQVLGLAQSLLG
jgi:hypothetical protein